MSVPRPLAAVLLAGTLLLAGCGDPDQCIPNGDGVFVEADDPDELCVFRDGRWVEDEDDDHGGHGVHRPVPVSTTRPKPTVHPVPKSPSRPTVTYRTVKRSSK